MSVIARMRAGGEIAASCIFECILITRDRGSKQIFEKVRWPQIVNWEKEFPVPRGRADFVLFHLDGSITVVEVKRGDRPLMELMAGIGQVTSYATQVGYSNIVGASIKRVLAVTALPNLLDELLLADACKLAGVEYFALGPLKVHQDIYEKVVAVSENHG